MLLSRYLISLQNNVKKSERSVPAVNKHDEYTLGTFDGKYVQYVEQVLIYCLVLESTSDFLKKLKNAKESNEAKLAI